MDATTTRKGRKANPAAAARLDREAFQTQAQAERYREMGQALRLLDPTYSDGVVNEEVARFVRLAAEMDEAAEELWAAAHLALTGRA